MNRIKVMVNGLPGNVTQMIAQYIARNDALTLLPYSLTGPEIEIDRISVEDMTIELIAPDRRDASIMAIKDAYDAMRVFTVPMVCRSSWGPPAGIVSNSMKPSPNRLYRR
jgi:hypothetical protein